MTVIYDPTDKLKLITTIHGTVWKQVLWPCIITSTLTAIIFVLKHHYDIDLTFPDKGHTYLSVLISFLTVTRANITLQRFWEARGELNTALRSCRDLSMSVLAFTGRDDSGGATRWRVLVKDRLIRLLRTAMLVIQDEGMTIRLSQGDWDSLDKDLIDKYKLNTEEILVDPLDVAASLQVIIHKQDEYLEKPLDIVSQAHLHACVNQFIAAYYDLTKFNTTPTPFPKVNMTRIILFLFIFTLPFVVVHHLDYVFPCVLLVFFITYGFGGMEFVSVELHNPFGDDPNNFEIYRYTEVRNEISQRGDRLAYCSARQDSFGPFFIMVKLISLCSTSEREKKCNRIVNLPVMKCTSKQITIQGIQKDLQGANLRFCNSRSDMMNKHRFFSNRWDHEVCQSKGEGGKFFYRPSVVYEGQRGLLNVSIADRKSRGSLWSSIGSSVHKVCQPDDTAGIAERKSRGGIWSSTGASGSTNYRDSIDAIQGDLLHKMRSSSHSHGGVETIEEEEDEKDTHEATETTALLQTRTLDPGLPFHRNAFSLNKRLGHKHESSSSFLFYY